MRAQNAHFSLSTRPIFPSFMIHEKVQRRQLIHYSAYLSYPDATYQAYYTQVRKKNEN